MVRTTVTPLYVEERYDYIFKLILLGDMGVGKTNLMSRFADDTFIENHQSTIQPDFRTKTVEINGKKVKVQITDTSGQERFRAVTSPFYRMADGALLVYDITRFPSYESLNYWVCQIQEQSKKNPPIMLVGNKSDLGNLRDVPTEEATAFAELNQLFFIETSALDSTNVKKAFILLLVELCKRADSQPAPVEQDKNAINLLEKPKNKCPC